MNYATLKTRLTDDPNGIGYAGMTDAEATEAGNQSRHTVQRSREVTALTIANEHGRDVARRLSQSLQSASSSDPLLVEMLHLLRNGIGIDVNHAETRATLDEMAVNENLPLTADDAAKIKSMADQTISDFEDAGLGHVYPRDAAKARAR